MAFTDVRFRTSGIPHVIGEDASLVMMDRVSFEIDPSKPVIGVAVHSVNYPRYPDRVFFSTREINFVGLTATLPDGFHTWQRIPELLNETASTGTFSTNGDRDLIWTADSPGVNIQIILGDDDELRAGVENLLGVLMDGHDTFPPPIAKTLLDFTSAADDLSVTICRMGAGISVGPGNAALRLDSTANSSQEVIQRRGESTGEPNYNRMFPFTNYEVTETNEFSASTPEIIPLGDRVAFIQDTTSTGSTTAVMEPAAFQANPDVAKLLGFQTRITSTTNTKHYGDRHYESIHVPLYFRVEFAGIPYILNRRFESGKVDAPVKFIQRAVSGKQKIHVAVTRPDAGYHSRYPISATLRLYHSEFRERHLDSFPQNVVYQGFGTQQSGFWPSGGRI